MSVLDLAFKRMAMMSTLQNQFNAQNKAFFGNNKNLGVLQRGRGLPRGRGGLMRQGPRLPGKITKHKKFVEAEIADVKKKEEKPIVEEGEEEEEEVQNNMLEGEVSSPFAKALGSDSEEESEEVTTEPSKVVHKKSLDEAIMKQSTSGQKKVIQRLFQTESFGKSYGSNARSKPIMFIPEKGSPVAYESMSAMTRVTGLSKAKLIGKSKFKAMGDIKRSSSAMNKVGLKGVLVSADDDMFTALQLTPLSGRIDKVRHKVLEVSIPEAPTGELISKKSTNIYKSQQLLTTTE
jgi:hypothetical protein